MPRSNQSGKSVVAKSAVKMQKWWQKVPPKQQSDGKKCPTQISEKKLWWRKVLSKWKSGGGKCHQNSKVMAESATTFQIWWNLSHHTHNCGGTLTTTYHISGAGAPAKTKKYVNADAFVFFREKVRPFPHLAKPMNTILRKPTNKKSSTF